MSEWKASTERMAPARHGHRLRLRLRLRWARVATLVAVLLIHLGFLVFLLAPPPAWRWPATPMVSAAPDALFVRLLPARPRPAVPARPAAPHAPIPVHALSRVRHPAPVARSTHATAQAAPSPSAPRAIDSLIIAAPPDFIAGGGRLSGPDYGNQNVRVPGSSAPVRGMPVFRMADPRMQGVAGVARVLQSLVGAVDSHCAKLEAWRGMTPRERAANHVDADAAQMATMASHYGCPDPLKPGAAMYYFTHH